MTTYRTETKIEVTTGCKALGFKVDAGKVLRTRKSMMPMIDGYVPVRLVDGSEFLIHESGFKVTDARIGHGRLPSVQPAA